MTRLHRSAGQRSRKTLIGAVAYLAFVVYGSLVPLDFQPGSLSEAWPRFLQTSYLNLGVGDRADWVANILLYIPLAYLWSAALANASDRAVGRMMRGAIVFVGCVVVAVSIEFAQLFFPPRTVSLNDLLAEAIGSALGIWGWLVLGHVLQRLGAQIATGGRIAIRATLALYLLVYVAYSLFPYDFLVSSQELLAKLAGDSYAFWLVRETCSRYAFCAAKLAVEALAIMPVGALLGPLLARNRAPYAAALIIGIVLGVAIEAMQMLIASGVSEGASAASRAAGMVAGLACYRMFDIRWIARIRRYLGRIVLTAVPFYVVGLAWANRLVAHGWSGLDEATLRLSDTHLLPFYYHYYTTETLALQSLIATVAIYAPIGIGYWMWRERSRPGIPGSAVVPAGLGALLALAVETAKLFSPGTHPDPTNVLIAGIASATTYLLAATAHRWAIEPASTPPSASLPAPATPASHGEPASSWGVAGAMLLMAGVITALWAYPAHIGYLAAALGLWAVALWRWPVIGLPTAVAVLPLLDFSDWTGWVVINEFDLFMAVTLAVTLVRANGRKGERLLDRPARFVLTMAAASFIGSALVGLFPLSPLDGNALFSYMTGYSALRALKGPLWALLMLPLFSAAGAQWPRRLTGGIVAGVCAVTAIVLWQRIAFAGLFDTTSDYRVEGMFPELRVGGGDIHAYLVMASPFIVAWTVQRLFVTRFLLGTTLLVLASYALAVTFTRGGYVGLAGALALLAVFSLWRLVRAGTARAAIGVAVAMLASAIVVLPLMYGSFMHARVATSADEAGVRLGHWARAIGMIDRSPRALVLGMGLGTFPRMFLFKEPTLASASLSYERRNGETFARLGSGRPLYLQQVVDIEPHSHYRLSVEVRAPNGDAAIDVSLCEKTYQYSFQCRRLLEGAVAPKQWTRRDVDFDSADLGEHPPWRKRPILLGISNSGVGRTLDVRNVELWDARHADRVTNGDFARGGARWNFAADDHLPWHIFNLWVEILFEQGLFGIVSLLLLLYVAIGRMVKRAGTGEWFSMALLASTTGFLLIGLSESLLDGPRVATLFFVTLIAALISRTADKRATSIG